MIKDPFASAIHGRGEDSEDIFAEAFRAGQGLARGMLGGKSDADDPFEILSRTEPEPQPSGDIFAEPTFTGQVPGTPMAGMRQPDPTPEDIRIQRIMGEREEADWRKGFIGYMLSSGHSLGSSVVKGMVDFVADTGEWLGVSPSEVMQEFSAELGANMLEHQQQQAANVANAMEEAGMPGRIGVIVGQGVVDTAMFLLLIKGIGIKYLGGKAAGALGMKGGVGGPSSKMLSHLKEAGKMGVFRFITTPGTGEHYEDRFRERLFSAATSIAYRATPAFSGLAHTTMKAATLDFLLNSGISLAMSKQYQQAWHEGIEQAYAAGDEDAKLAYALTNVIPVLGSDLYFSAFTKSFRDVTLRQMGAMPQDRNLRPAARDAAFALATQRNSMLKNIEDLPRADVDKVMGEIAAAQGVSRDEADLSKLNNSAIAGLWEKYVAQPERERIQEERQKIDAEEAREIAKAQEKESDVKARFERGELKPEEVSAEMEVPKDGLKILYPDAKERNAAMKAAKEARRMGMVEKGNVEELGKDFKNIREAVDWFNKHIKKKGDKLVYETGLKKDDVIKQGLEAMKGVEEKPEPVSPPKEAEAPKADVPAPEAKAPKSDAKPEAPATDRPGERPAEKPAEPTPAPEMGLYTKAERKAKDARRAGKAKTLFANSAPEKRDKVGEATYVDTPEGRYIIDMSVEEAFQERGIGTRLLDRALQYDGKVFLEAESGKEGLSDAKLRSWYAKRGFRALDNEGRMVADGRGAPAKKPTVKKRSAQKARPLTTERFQKFGEVLNREDVFSKTATKEGMTVGELMEKLEAEGVRATTTQVVRALRGWAQDAAGKWTHVLKGKTPWRVHRRDGGFKNYTITTRATPEMAKVDTDAAVVQTAGARMAEERLSEIGKLDPDAIQIILGLREGKLDERARAEVLAELKKYYPDALEIAKDKAAYPTKEIRDTLSAMQERLQRGTPGVRVAADQATKDFTGRMESLGWRVTTTRSATSPLRATATDKAGHVIELWYAKPPSAKGRKDVMGELKREGRVARIYVNPDTGDRTTVFHELGHLVRDTLTGTEWAIVKGVFGKDISTKRGEEKHGDEWFAKQMQTEEGRNALAERIAQFAPARQNIAIRALNKVIDVINAVRSAMGFGKIKHIGRDALRKDILTLANALRDFNALRELGEGKREALDTSERSARAMVSHHASPHTFAPVAVVRLADGSEREFKIGERLPDEVASAIQRGEATIQNYKHGRFDLKKIGTGEGSQSRGWGIYFAEAEGVGRDYWRRFAGERRGAAEAWKDFEARFPSEAGVFADEIAGESSGRSITAADLGTELANAQGGSRQTSADISGARTVPATSLYRLDIPDDVVPKLLDWDGPIPAGVKEKIIAELDRTSGGLGWRSDSSGARRNPWSESVHTEGGGGIPKGTQPPARDKVVDAIRKASTGEELLKAIRLHYAHGDAEAKVLNKIGIPGLRFLDQGSRDAGEGTRNTVIWDQPTLDRIALLERNGERLDQMREDAAGDTRLSDLQARIDAETTMEAKQRVLDAWKADPANAEAIRGAEESLKSEGFDIEAWHVSKDIGFTTFDETKRGVRDFGIQGRGFYFTTDEARADGYMQDKRIKVPQEKRKFFLRLRNPMVDDSFKTVVMDETQGAKQRDDLAARGYDGIVNTGEYMPKDVVVFDASNIRPSPLTLRPDGTLAGLERERPESGRFQLAETPDPVNVSQMVALPKDSEWRKGYDEWKLGAGKEMVKGHSMLEKIQAYNEWKKVNPHADGALVNSVLKVSSKFDETEFDPVHAADRAGFGGKLERLAAHVQETFRPWYRIEDLGPVAFEKYMDMSGEALNAKGALNADITEAQQTPERIKRQTSIANTTASARIRATVGGRLKDGRGGKEVGLVLDGGHHMMLAAMHGRLNAAKEAFDRIAADEEATPKVRRQAKAHYKKLLNSVTRFVVDETSRGDIRRVYHVTPAELERISNALTPEMRAEMEQSQKEFNQMYEAVNKVYKRINGQDLPQEAFYFHLIRDPAFVRKNKASIVYSAAQDKVKITSEQVDNAFNILNKRNIIGAHDPANKSFLQVLQYSDAPVMVRDFFDERSTHLSDVLQYVGAQPVKNWIEANFTLNPNVVNQLNKTRRGQKNLEYLQQFAEGVGGFVHGERTVFDKVVTHMLNNMTLTRLFNPAVWAKQATSTASLVSYFDADPRYLTSAFKKRDKDFIDSVFKSKEGGYLRGRFASKLYHQALFEYRGAGAADYITGREGKIKGIPRKARRWGTTMMSKGDRVAINGGIMMARDYVLDKHPGLKGQEFIDAVAREAVKAIRMTQVSTEAIDRTLLEQKIQDPYRRMLVYMWGARGAQFNLLAKSAARMWRDKDVESLRWGINTILMAGLAQSMGIALIDRFRDKYREHWTEPSDEDLNEAQRIGLMTLENVASTVPVLSSAVGAFTAPIWDAMGAKEAAQLRRYMAGDRGPLDAPIQDLRVLLGHAGRLKKAENAMREAKTPAQRRRAKQRAKQATRTFRKSLIRLGSETLGVPVSQVHAWLPDMGN